MVDGADTGERGLMMRISTMLLMGGAYDDGGVFRVPQPHVGGAYEVGFVWEFNDMGLSTVSPSRGRTTIGHIRVHA